MDAQKGTCSELKRRTNTSNKENYIEDRMLW